MLLLLVWRAGVLHTGFQVLGVDCCLLVPVSVWAADSVHMLVQLSYNAALLTLLGKLLVGGVGRPEADPHRLPWCVRNLRRWSLNLLVEVLLPVMLVVVVHLGAC